MKRWLAHVLGVDKELKKEREKSARLRDVGFRFFEECKRSEEKNTELRGEIYVLKRKIEALEITNRELNEHIDKNEAQIKSEKEWRKEDISKLGWLYARNSELESQHEMDVLRTDHLNSVIRGYKSALSKKKNGSKRRTSKRMGESIQDGTSDRGQGLSGENPE